MDIRAAVSDVLTRIKVIRMIYKVLADTCSHAEAKIRVDIDLADSTLCSFAKLIFRNTDSVLESAAVSIDDSDVLLRN